MKLETGDRTRNVAATFLVTPRKTFNMLANEFKTKQNNINLTQHKLVTHLKFTYLINEETQKNPFLFTNSTWTMNLLIYTDVLQ